jgi:transposase-like protein
MTIRRRFSGAFKAKVALDALRGDLTLQELAARHKVHPNQVSAWKRQAIEGMSDVFSGKTSKAASHRADEVHALHAKIVQLTVERDFLASGLKR